MFNLSRILVPVDFSACSRAALDYAAFVARKFSATIDVLHVWEPPRPLWWEGMYPVDVIGEQRTLVAFESSRAGREMKAFLAHLEEDEGLCTRGRLESGDPYRTILAVARDDRYDLIVMGTHGRTGMSHLILGSLAEAVVRRAPCPVVTVRSTDPIVWRAKDDPAQLDHLKEATP